MGHEKNVQQNEMRVHGHKLVEEEGHDSRCSGVVQLAMRTSQLAYMLGS
jgi:uncharacterized protein YsxB (DUF464 family)